MIISCNNKINSNKNISDEDIALKIAEDKFNEVYGKDKIANEQPFKAKKINDSIWFVDGTLPKGYKGGVAYGKVDVKNKKFIKFSHSK